MRRGRDGPRDHHRTPLGRPAIDGSGSIRREIALKIGVIARQMRKRFDRNLGALGVTRSRWTLIAVVSHRPGATQRAIAEALEMSEASAGRLIDRLCAEGLLERRPKEDDRRAYCVFLTENAKPVLEELGLHGRDSENETFAGLSEGELRQLAALLAKVYANVTAQKD